MKIIGKKSFINYYNYEKNSYTLLELIPKSN